MEFKGSDEEREQTIIERHYSRRLQVRMVAEGLLVGCVGGAVIALYRYLLSGSEQALRTMLASLGDNPLMWLLWCAMLACIALVIGRLMQLVPDTRGSGIPQIDAEVMGRYDAAFMPTIAAKIAEGTLCTLSGLSLGREGPSVQLGGMTGKAVSRLLHKRRNEEHVLITCGAAAGMSAAFHAPLTGVLFTLEEIHREFNTPLVVTAMASAASSDFVASQLLGVEPVLHFALVGDLPHVDYALVLVMGLICGVAGALHNVGMFFLQDRLIAPLRSRIGDGVLLLAFGLTAIAGAFAPQLLCGGDAILHYLEEPGRLSALVILSLLIGKYLFTGVCFASGAPGGTLLPLVIMGSLIGALCGLGAVGATDMPFAYLNNFIVLGVAGLFAGSVRAPVTAVVLCFELTGTLDTLLAATAVSLTAFITANLVGVEPFYEHLLAKLLVANPDEEPVGPEAHAGAKVLHTHVVGVGSKVEGMLVQEVTWPEQILLVTIDRAGERIIPEGSTQLRALDEVLVIMDVDQESDAEEALHHLFQGMSL